MKKRNINAVAEEATGTRQHPKGFGRFYSNTGAELTPEEAQDEIEAGRGVALPNSGAGSYRAVFAALGFSKCEVFEWTSSAGDWSFAVFDGESWFPASQDNRYPHYGFSYHVNRDMGFRTKEDCFYYMGNG